LFERIDRFNKKKYEDYVLSYSSFFKQNIEKYTTYLEIIADMHDRNESENFEKIYNFKPISNALLKLEKIYSFFICMNNDYTKLRFLGPQK